MSVHDWIYIDNSPGFDQLLQIVLQAVEPTRQEWVTDGFYFFVSDGIPATIMEDDFEPHEASIQTVPGKGKRLFDLVAQADSTLGLRLATEDDRTLATRPSSQRLPA